MDIIGWILVVGGTAIAGLLTKFVKKVWDKAQKVKLVKDLVDSLKDGEVSKEELQKIYEDIKALLADKKKE